LEYLQDLLVYSKEGGHKIYSENLQIINIPVTDKFLNLTTLNERGYDAAYAEFHNSELFYFLGIYTGKYYYLYFIYINGYCGRSPMTIPCHIWLNMGNQNI